MKRLALSPNRRSISKACCWNGNRFGWFFGRNCRRDCKSLDWLACSQRRWKMALNRIAIHDDFRSLLLCLYPRPSRRSRIHRQARHHSRDQAIDMSERRTIVAIVPALRRGSIAANRSEEMILRLFGLAISSN